MRNVIIAFISQNLIVPKLPKTKIHKNSNNEWEQVSLIRPQKREQKTEDKTWIMNASFEFILNISSSLWKPYRWLLSFFLSLQIKWNLFLFNAYFYSYSLQRHSEMHKNKFFWFKCLPLLFMFKSYEVDILSNYRSRRRRGFTAMKVFA